MSRHHWHKSHKDELTPGQHIADVVAATMGSWSFIIIQSAILGLWIVYNSWSSSFDPYPFILLNLALSTVAALQAPVIMMSQNRQAAKDRSDAQNDYQVNLKSEMEIMSLHAKLDDARERELRELLEISRRQSDTIETLTSMVQRLSADRGNA